LRKCRRPSERSYFAKDQSSEHDDMDVALDCIFLRTRHLDQRVFLIKYWKRAILKKPRRMARENNP
jgi:hypothetical protein